MNICCECSADEVNAISAIRAARRAEVARQYAAAAFEDAYEALKAAEAVCEEAATLVACLSQKAALVAPLFHEDRLVQSRAKAKKAARKVLLNGVSN